MRIDAHHHVWDLAVRDQPWTAALPALRRTFTVDDLRPSAARHGIDATVVVQTVCVPEETPELLALAARDPLVAGVVGWVDLTAPDVGDRLDALRGLPAGRALVGVRHQVQEEPDPRWLCRPDVRRGLAAVADAGLAYDLVVTPDQLPAVVDTVRAVPGLKFVLDHAGKPPIASGVIAPWESDVRKLAASANVAAKLSGLVTEADHDTWEVADLRPYADVVLDAFGPGRVMFGSDWPVCLLAGGYDRVVAAAEALAAELSGPERAAVFGGTARRWYGLDDEGTGPR
ncbi:amidohydrolase family protein [Luteimicrobium sp. DT211]|uniref:amidohydrolase family protein n=1 Tax=Luteimicrobium sp. DT211 TaxID=3393412 RepID=UPI003CF7C8E7